MFWASGQKIFRYSFLYTQRWLVAFDEKFNTEIVDIWGTRTNARKIFLVEVLKSDYIAEWTGRCEILASSTYIIQRGHLSEALDQACTFRSGMFICHIW